MEKISTYEQLKNLLKGLTQGFSYDIPSFDEDVIYERIKFCGINDKEDLEYFTFWDYVDEFYDEIAIDYKESLERQYDKELDEDVVSDILQDLVNVDSGNIPLSHFDLAKEKVMSELE